MKNNEPNKSAEPAVELSEKELAALAGGGCQGEKGGIQPRIG